MKTTFMTLIAALFLSFTASSCDRDGNTGNGANDPTSKFESDKAMKAGDKYGQGTDTAAKETTTLTTIDTTMVEDRHK